MKKILYIEGSSRINYPADPAVNVGGSTISLYYLVKDLDRKKFKPAVFSYYDSYVFKEFSKLNCRVMIDARKRKKRKSKKYFQAVFKEDFYESLSFFKLFLLRILPRALKLVSILKKEKPDIVHCNLSLRQSMAPIIASRIACIPCICHVRGYTRLNSLNKAFSHFVRCFICVSDTARSNYLMQGIKKEKTVVIPLGIDAQEFLPVSHHTQKEKDFIVTSVGRMNEWKGQWILLEAIPLITQKIKNVQFWLVGDGPERPNLERKAHVLNISQFVKFKGTFHRIQNILSSSDLLIHTPVKPEPFGRIIIEAMAMQIPVIATNLGGPSEYITNNRDGILIDTKRPDVLAEKIVQVLENPDLRQKMGEAARKTVIKQFDNKNIMKEIERIYDIIA